ncbi:hypothetical protein ABDD95_19315 [Mucilaginibacter sp. PAMB04274]|uniref:hypothetical protein n=1 Tax=Mucilaginibacter sp. PAMB04274 TaxID=3138568 RepID=UPI0031F64F4E
MFKRIHSNRDPGDTLGGELKKEFAVYFGKAGRIIRKLLEQNPRYTLIGMSLCILLSLVLSFTLFRQPQATAPATTPAKAAAEKQIAPVRDGLDQILATTSALQQTLALKKQVEALLAKPVLTPADSADLEKALDRLNQLQNHLNQKP